MLYIGKLVSVLSPVYSDKEELASVVGYVVEEAVRREHAARTGDSGRASHYTRAIAMWLEDSRSFYHERSIGEGLYRASRGWE